MTTRVVTDTIRAPDGSPWPEFTLAFTVTPSTYHSDAHYPHKTVRATTDETGAFSIELVTDVRYMLDLESAFIRNGSSTGYPADSKNIPIVVPGGDGPITLAEVRGLEGIDPAVPDVKAMIQQIIADYLDEHGGTSATWGGIVGNLADQSDLQTALTDIELTPGPPGERGEDGRTPITVSEIPPPDPQEGDLWYQP